MLSAERSVPSTFTPDGHPSLVDDDHPLTTTPHHNSSDGGNAMDKFKLRSIHANKDKIMKDVPSVSNGLTPITATNINTHTNTSTNTQTHNTSPPNITTSHSNTHTPLNVNDKKKQIHPNNAPALEASTTATNSSPTLNHADSAVKDPSSSSTQNVTKKSGSGATRIVSPTRLVGSTLDIMNTPTNDMTRPDKLAANELTSVPLLEQVQTGIHENANPIELSQEKSLKRTVPETNIHPMEDSALVDTRSNNRDDLPLDLRNKKMKPTDCLLFAATLLEDDKKSKSITDTLANTPKSDGDKPRWKFSVSNAMDACPPGKLPLFPLPQKTQIQQPLVPPLVSIDSTNNSEVDSSVVASMSNPRDVDVLCGRGGLINKHAGNIIYRKIVDHNKPFYQSVHKKHRILVSQSIVQSIVNFGGRFLILNKTKAWTKIGYKRAVQKTSQALRERNTADEHEVTEGDEPNNTTSVHQSADSDEAGEPEDDRQ
jgi:hypothetical protein